MTSLRNSKRGGQVYGTGPDWEIIQYEYQNYTPHRYDHARQYDHVCLPSTTHEYKGHSYDKLREWNEIRTYEPIEYKPQFYIAPRHKPPPPKVPPTKKPRHRNRDYQWARLYKCYEEPIGPERKVRECPINDYRNQDYNPAVTEYRGDKVMYMDRELKMYKGSAHYTLTGSNFYPYRVRNEYKPEKDINENITKEATATSLKEVKLQEAVKKDKNTVVAAAVVVPQGDKDNEQVIVDSSWVKEEPKQEEAPPPQPVRENTPQQTMSTSHGVQAEDRLTPVNTVVAAGAIAAVANTSNIKKDDKVETGNTEPKSDVQETSKSNNDKTNEPVSVPVVAAATVIAPASAKNSTPAPSRSGSVASVRSSNSMASVPGGVAIAGAVVASDIQSKNNPSVQQNNSSQDSADESKSQSKNTFEKAPSPAPVVPLVAAAAVGANAATAAPKESAPTPKQEVPQQTRSPTPAKSPSPPPVVPVAAAATAGNHVTAKETNKPPAHEEPVQEDKHPTVETSTPQNAGKPTSPNSGTNLPPEVIATIEAYDAAHDGNEITSIQNSVGTVKRTIQLTS